MTKTLVTTLGLLYLASSAAAAIYTEIPPGDERRPTQAVTYKVNTLEGGSIVSVDISDMLSYDLLGSIPPNETLTVDVASELGTGGQPYRVIGLGWDVLLDAFAPSWMSDSSFAFGDDASFVDPDLILTPAMGFDFPGFMRFESGGIVDLNDFQGSGKDLSFELAEGILYLEFFETYDDFGGPVPDALWRQVSTLTLQVMPVPEPSTWVGLGFAALMITGRRRRA